MPDQLPTVIGDEGPIEVVPVMIFGGDGTASPALSASSSGVITSVPDNASSVTILAANSARKGGVVTNTSSAVLFLKLAAGAASASSFTYRLAQNASVDIPSNYQGVIMGMWATDPNDGQAVVTEFA